MVDWNKPQTITVKASKEMKISSKYAKYLLSGTFRFNDGTTQFWTIDQLYDTYDNQMKQIMPYMGFSLSNSQNIALAAEASPLVVLGSKAQSFDFYLLSPDLSKNTDWKDVKGYSLDVQRFFGSPCGEPEPPKYFIQLQVQVWDKLKKKMRIFAEYDSKKDEYIFHPIKLAQPYYFTWSTTFLPDTNLELRFLRIRFIQPNMTAPGAGDCLQKGKWLIGNVARVK